MLGVLQGGRELCKAKKDHFFRDIRRTALESFRVGGNVLGVDTGDPGAGTQRVCVKNRYAWLTREHNYSKCLTFHAQHSSLVFEGCCLSLQTCSVFQSWNVDDG